MERSTGLVVIAIGGVVVLVGILILTGALGWFGRLPGDLRHQGERTGFFFPVTSMIVVSIVLTVVVNLVLRLWR
jgi:hypothetical protein